MANTRILSSLPYKTSSFEQTMKEFTAYVDTKFPSILHGKVQSGQAQLEWKVSTADVVQVQDFVLRLKRSFPDHFNYKKKEGKEELELLSFYGYGDNNRATRTNYDWCNSLIQAFYIANLKEMSMNATNNITLLRNATLSSIDEISFHSTKENRGLLEMYSCNENPKLEAKKVLEFWQKEWNDITTCIKKGFLAIDNYVESTTGLKGITSSSKLDKGHILRELQAKGLVNDLGVLFFEGALRDIENFHWKGIVDQHTAHIWAGTNRTADDFTFMERKQNTYNLSKDSLFHTSKLLSEGQ
jgi:hypothetical protein